MLGLPATDIMGGAHLASLLNDNLKKGMDTEFR